MAEHRIGAVARIRGVVLGAGILILAALVVERGGMDPALRDPMIQGRPASSWMDQYRHGTALESEFAGRVLEQAAESLLPPLRRELRAPAPTLRRLAFDWAGRAPPVVRDWLPAIRDPYLEKVTAVRTLGFLGRAAEPALPELMGAFRSRDLGLSMAARATLVRIGSADVVKALIQAGADPGFVRRSEAIYALRDVGPPAAAAVPWLRRWASDENTYIRESSRQALSSILSGPR